MPVSVNATHFLPLVRMAFPLMAFVSADGVSTIRALVKFDVSWNILFAEGGKAIAEALKNHPVLTDLKIAGNSLSQDSDREPDLSGVIAISNAIPTMGALTSLNISSNGITGAEAGKALGDALAATAVLKELDLSAQDDDSDWGDAGIASDQNLDARFAKEFAIGLANGALTSLNVSSNSIKGAEAGKALGNALAANTVLKQLDLSKNYSGAEFANEFAVGLGANGALETLNLSHNKIVGDSKNFINAAEGVGNKFEADGVQWTVSTAPDANGTFTAVCLTGLEALSDAIKTNRTLYSVNISNNNIPDKQAREVDKQIRHNRLRPIMQDREQSLSDLDLSSRCLDHKDASVVAEYIANNGAMTSLDISNNKLVHASDWIDQDDHGFKVGDMIEHEGVQCPVSQAISSSYKVMMMHGIVALAKAIPTMGAMNKLTISGDASWSEAATIETSMTEADFIGKALGASGAIMLATFLPKCQ